MRVFSSHLLISHQSQESLVLVFYRFKLSNINSLSDQLQRMIYTSILWKNLGACSQKKPLLFIEVQSLCLNPPPPFFPVESEAEKRWWFVNTDYVAKLRSVVNEVCDSSKYSSHFAIAEAPYIKSPLFLYEQEPVCLLC